MGDSPPGPGDPPPLHLAPVTPPVHMAATSKEGGGPVGAKKMRSFAQILADEKETRNILEIKLTKCTVVEDGKDKLAKSLMYEQVGELLFDVLKFKPEHCAGVALSTSRYDTKEIKLKPGVDPMQYLTTAPIKFLDHEVEVRIQSAKVTQVVFKHVPLNIPDEEIIHLCQCYGEPMNNQVYYDKPNNSTRGVAIAGATRSVEMKMLPGKQFENFYWMEGPLEGDQGCRITVLHPGQSQQCSHCLRREDRCPGAGVGKACKDKGTKRGAIADYMRHLMLQHNYKSLKLQHSHEYPTLGSSSNDGFGHMLEKEANEEDKAVNISVIDTVNIEKITLLEQQLSEANAARQQQLME